jgi:hypothetical protein
MAKKMIAQPQPAPTPSADGESTAGYFCRIFKENPKLLGETSNRQLLDGWLADHPGHAEVPANIKANLSNLKSVLRSKQRKKVARRAEGEQIVDKEMRSVARVATGKALELQIDECLILAKQLDREGLEGAINHLRRARNEVVWKIGQ